MPKNVQGPGQVSGVTSRDISPPPTPQVQVSIAFERAAKDATFRPNPPPITQRPGGRDPVYLELSNVEVGTTIQLLNLSANPGASWNDAKAVVELPLTGRDIANRQASAFLNAEQMDKLGLQPGHMIQLRAVDTANPANVSPAVTTELMPNEWVNGQVSEKNGDAFVTTPGAQFNMLDGEAKRVAVMAKSVFDVSEPIVTTLQEKVSIVVDERFSPEDKALGAVLNSGWGAMQRAMGKDSFTAEELKTQSTNEGYPENFRTALKTLLGDSALFARFDAARTGSKDDQVNWQDVGAVANFTRTVTLKASEALEPGANVQVQNQRTNSTTSGSVGNDRQLSVPVNDAADGDPLRITVQDNNNIQGAPFIITFRPDGKNGVGAAPPTPALPGVIDQ
ncbi:MAG: hypothetical protein K1X89_04165 [Myxococcaceae bacterium]|nr:hypothetical protein [Myxococcaceae bacterium]